MSTHWQAALKTHWEIEGNLSKLDGEYDLNFLVEGSKDYVLKVMRAGCESSFIDMQCKAINHLTSKASNLPIPQIIPTTKGELYIKKL